MKLVKCDVCGKTTDRKNLNVAIDDNWIEVHVGVGPYYSMSDIEHLGPWQICSWECVIKHAEKRKGRQPADGIDTFYGRRPRHEEE